MANTKMVTIAVTHTDVENGLVMFPREARGSGILDTKSSSTKSVGDVVSKKFPRRKVTPPNAMSTFFS